MTEQDIELRNEALVEDILSGDIQAFRETFIDMHPYDQGQFFIEQTSDIRMHIYEYLSPDEVALIMENISIDEVLPFSLKWMLNTPQWCYPTWQLTML